MSPVSRAGLDTIATAAAALSTPADVLALLETSKQGLTSDEVKHRIVVRPIAPVRPAHERRVCTGLRLPGATTTPWPTSSTNTLGERAPHRTRRFRSCAPRGLSHSCVGAEQSVVSGTVRMSIDTRKPWSREHAPVGQDRQRLVAALRQPGRPVDGTRPAHRERSGRVRVGDRELGAGDRDREDPARRLARARVEDVPPARVLGGGGDAPDRSSRLPSPRGRARAGARCRPATSIPEPPARGA